MNRREALKAGVVAVAGVAGVDMALAEGANTYRVDVGVAVPMHVETRTEGRELKCDISILAPGDKVVVKVNEELSPKIQERYSKQLKAAFPLQDVVLVTGDVRLFLIPKWQDFGTEMGATGTYWDSKMDEMPGLSDYELCGERS